MPMLKFARNSTERTLLGFLLGVTFCGALACSSSEHTMALDNSDSGRTVSLTAGDALDITLGGIGNVGEPSVSSTTIRYDGRSVVGPVNPGGPTYLYKFTAVSPGAAAITIPFFSVNNQPPFVLDVNVE